VITTNPDAFAYAAIWSAGVNPATAPDFEQRAEAFFNNPDKVNKSFKLLSISCGDKDTLAINGSKNLDAILKKHNIKHETMITSGAHTWINWRRYLNDYAPKLFR
jgi:S-formylglutathione hydrolase FrmB